MNNFVEAFFATVIWIVLAWVVGSAIHFFYPDVLIYFAPIAVFWIIAMGVHAYVVDDEDQGGSMAYTTDELER